MYDAILAAVDGSDESTAALEHALGLAEAVDATLHVVTVVESTGSPLTFGVGEVDALNRAAEEVVEDVLAAHEDEDVEVTGDVRRGRPDEAIRTYADEAAVDLVVVGQRGADGVSAAILGSTADRLSRTADVPVTIVPAEEGTEAA